MLSANVDYTSPNVWPPITPDLIPMDNKVCGADKKDANRRDRTTKAQLMDRIKAVFETLAPCSGVGLRL